MKLYYMKFMNMLQTIGEVHHRYRSVVLCELPPLGLSESFSALLLVSVKG